jgi:hypothetical protein
MQFWKKLSQIETRTHSKALNENVNFAKDTSLGYPASKLDGKVFYSDAPFLKDALHYKHMSLTPTISVVILGTSEKAFKEPRNGTKY